MKESALMVSKHTGDSSNVCGVRRKEARSATWQRARKGYLLVAPVVLMMPLFLAGSAGAQMVDRGIAQQPQFQQPLQQPGMQQPQFQQPLQQPGMQQPQFQQPMQQPGMQQPQFQQPMQQPGMQQPGMAQPAQFAQVRVSDILDDPGAFIGRWVDVRGDLDDVISPRVFTFEEESRLANLWGLFSREMLVVSPLPLDQVPGLQEVRQRHLFADSTIRIRGVVQRFDLTQLQQQFGVIFDQQLFGPFQGQPTLIATEMNLGQGFFAITPGGRLDTTGLTPLSQILRQPQAFANATVVVGGTVQNITGRQTFTIIQPGLGQEVLVISRTAGPVRDIRPGLIVQLTGTVRQFNVPLLERELGIILADQQLNRFAGQPVLIAERIHGDPFGGEIVGMESPGVRQLPGQMPGQMPGRLPQGS
jgi:hypothetical protein